MEESGTSNFSESLADLRAGLPRTQSGSNLPPRPPRPPSAQPSSDAPREERGGGSDEGGGNGGGDEGGLPSAAELEQTLRRLMRRLAMIIQAEKCVFLLHDSERQELVARPPALGLTTPQIKALRVPVDSGVSGQAFTSGEPVVVQDTAECDPTDQVWIKKLDVHSLIAYPLIVARRDEQARVAEHVTVGVLHVINKRGAERFGPEDLKLLSGMAHQVTTVIADAQIYLRLTEEKEQLQATLQSLLAGVVMVESSGHISLINSAAREMFGLDETDGVGSRFEDVISQQPIVDLLKSAIVDHQEMQTEIEIAPSAGNVEPRIFQSQTAFVRGEQDGVSALLGVVAIFNDITEIRNVDRIKTAFISTVSHELRTPLTSIKGFISTLLQDTEGYFSAEDRLEFYGIIDTECDRLRRLIDDLLNVSRIESGRAVQMHWSNFNPIPVIEKVLQAQRSYIDKHQLVLNPHEEIPHILGDSDKFDQILTNLISNAVKYSPAGGEVSVDISSDGLTLTVSVNDPGIGIPADKLSRIFEKFERVDNRDTREAGGTGIGLYLVKHLVERHEGHVWVESNVGKGSTFSFQIPLRPAQAEAEMKDDYEWSGGEG